MIKEAAQAYTCLHTTRWHESLTY